MKKLLISLILLLTLTFSLLAQENTGTPEKEEVEMADKFRADGKIYVVVAIVAILFSGILVYLIALDRKVRKMEDELEGGVKK